MADEPDNIVLQHLRAIREQLDTLNERQLEMMQRLGAVELAIANLSIRVDRIDARLDRVERRLGLIEA
jgi:predicted  nucleic acid-binding Zn-ribbon protein